MLNSVISAPPLSWTICHVCDHYVWSGKLFGLLKIMIKTRTSINGGSYKCSHCGAKLILNFRFINPDFSPWYFSIDESQNRFCPICKKWESTIKYTDDKHIKSVCSHCGANLIIKSGSWQIDDEN